LNKCVYCERGAPLVDTIVETFRPLRNASDIIGAIANDHYSWLAYEFDNLVLVCTECSSRKRSEFPLVGARAPYLTTMSEIRTRERPLVVDPFRGNPERHFLFLVDGRCEGTTQEGRITTRLLGLDNYALEQQRADEMETLVAHLQATIEGTGPSPLDYLARNLQFAGARIGFTRRLFDGVEIGGARLNGRSSAFVRELAAALREVSASDRERLFRRIDAVRQDDKMRLQPDAGAPLLDNIPYIRAQVPEYRPEPRRTGGVARVSICDFKGIHELEVALDRRRRSKSAPCLMLLGENAVGKSSVLQAIALALVGKRQAKRLIRDPSNYLRADLEARWDQLAPTRATIELDMRHAEGAHFDLGADGRVDGATDAACVVLGYGPRRYFDPRTPDRPKSDHTRVRTLFDPTAALPYAGVWLDHLEDRPFYEVAQVMRIVLSLSDTDEVLRDIDGRICVSLDGKPVPVERLSEGYRSVFALVADISRELLRDFRSLEDAEAVVLIDEIDTHLHPRWKMRVMSSLRRALPGVQFIVTTHDPLCLRGMDDGEVVVLQRNQDGRIVKLEGLPSIKGMRADQLLTSDFFGLSSTIDPETELDVARYVDSLADLPPDRVQEAAALVRHLALGDDALEQVVQSALLRFLREREQPRGALRSDVRLEAVQAVLDALESDHPALGGEPADT